MESKLKLLLLCMLFSTIAHSQFIKEDKSAQLSVWLDPVSTIKEKDLHVGMTLTKVMRWGYVSASVSTADLEASYTDLISSGGINFNLLNYDPVRYYAGLRGGVLWRDGYDFGLVGGEMGFDWRIWDGFGIGAKLWIDYRADQDDQFFGDSDAYERGWITDNKMLQENGSISLIFYF